MNVEDTFKTGDTINGCFTNLERVSLPLTIVALVCHAVVSSIVGLIFMILLLVFMVLNGFVPPYVADLLHHQTPELRSINQMLFNVLRSKYKNQVDAP